MESALVAAANDGIATIAPCTVVATLTVATRSRLVAWYYRRKLYYALFQYLDNNARVGIFLLKLEKTEIDLPSPLKTGETERHSAFRVSARVEGVARPIKVRDADPERFETAVEGLLRTVENIKGRRIREGVLDNLKDKPEISDKPEPKALAA